MRAELRATRKVPAEGGHTFLSNYLCQRNQTVQFLNPKAAPPSPGTPGPLPGSHFACVSEATGVNKRLLQKGIDGFAMTTVLPGRVDKVMTSAAMYLPMPKIDFVSQW